MNKYTKVEKEQNFVPLGSDYSRFVAMQEAKKIKRIPEVGAKMPSGKKEGIGKSVSEEKPEVKRLEERMRQSLGDTKPKSYTSSSDKSKQIEKTKQSLTGEKTPSKTTVIKKEREPKYIAGYQKAGKPSILRVNYNAKISDKQLEARKKMRGKTSFGKVR